MSEQAAGAADSTPGLGHRFPWLPRILLVMLALGLIGVYGWLRLGEGRLASSQYWCLILALISAAAAAAGAAGWAALTLQQPFLTRWSGRASGIAFSVVLFLGLYFAAQIVCRGIMDHRASRIVRTGSHSTGDAYQSGRVLGYMPRPSIEAGARLEVDGDLVFDYTYHTDSYRRRMIPGQHAGDPARKRALVFFGGSYAFGEGVNDDETLPSQVAQRLPDTAVYNYAFAGYGPNQMLARLQELDTPGEIPETDVTGIYVFIPNHVRRVIGSFAVISWSRHSPYYVLDDSGTPVRLGSFQGERPRLTRLYDLLKGDYLLQMLRIDLPPWLGPRHFELTAAIVAQSARRFGEQFADGKLLVILYPETGEERLHGRDLKPWFEKAGLTVLDYSEILSGAPEDYFYLPHDSHPRANAHALVAEKLVSDLAVLDSAN